LWRLRHNTGKAIAANVLLGRQARKQGHVRYSRLAAIQLRLAGARMGGAW
jgi:hypothetical protein